MLAAALAAALIGAVRPEWLRVFAGRRQGGGSPRAGHEPADPGAAAPFRGDAGDAAELALVLSGPHRVLYRGRSAYQEILLVEVKDVRLYLDGQLQFSALDEAYYHEALVYPAMALAATRARVLVLGGGDGLAVREILKYPDVAAVDLVDIDPAVLRLARRHPLVARLNGRALADRRVHLFPEDATRFVARAAGPYHVVVADFPDPADETLARLYSYEFYARLAGLLTPGGVLVTQAGSPEDAPRAYWTVGRTLAAAGLHVLSYHLTVPSFGDWGFHLAAPAPLRVEGVKVAVPCRALPAQLAPLCAFPEEVLEGQAGAAVHTLNRPVLHHIYQSEVGRGPATPT